MDVQDVLLTLDIVATLHFLLFVQKFAETAS